MANHTIVILGKRNPPKAEPPILLGDEGDKVRFDARGSAVQIKFWIWPFTERETLISLDRDGLSSEYTLKSYEKGVDEHPYSVFCASSGELAVGGSEPGIIIKRPPVSGG